MKPGQVSGDTGTAGIGTADTSTVGIGTADTGTAGTRLAAGCALRRLAGDDNERQTLSGSNGISHGTLK